MEQPIQRQMPAGGGGCGGLVVLGVPSGVPGSRGLLLVFLGFWGLGSQFGRVGGPPPTGIGRRITTGKINSGGGPRYPAALGPRVFRRVSDPIDVWPAFSCFFGYTFMGPRSAGEGAAPLPRALSPPADILRYRFGSSMPKKTE